MKKSAGKIFLSGFIKSLLFLFFLFFAGILSYKASERYLGIKEPAAISSNYLSEPLSITQARIDDISKNLIYCTGKGGTIDKMLLEVFNCRNKKLYYITIPVKTQFTMSNALYKRLELVKPSIPQVIKLSSLNNYFNKDAVYDYGVLLTEDLLDTDISYYTVIPKDLYDTIFIGQPGDQSGGQEADQAEGYPEEVFKDSYITFLKTLKTEADLRSYIKNIYPSVKSNLTLEGKMNYLESYSETPLSSVSFSLIPGKDGNSSYTVDKVAASVLLKECQSASNK